MTQAEILQRYVELCHTALLEDVRILDLLQKAGIQDSFLLESFSVGYADGRILEPVGENEEIVQKLVAAGILASDGKEVLRNRLIIPILDENKAIVNLVAYNLNPKTKCNLRWLHPGGLFNAPFLRNRKELIVTEDPLLCLLLIQQDVSNTTFLFGDDQKYVHFCQEHGIRKVFFSFEGKARLFYEFSQAGISTHRVSMDFERLISGKARDYLEDLFSASSENMDSSDKIIEIENGLLFQFPHLSYRVIGNFAEASLSLRANIKAFTDQEVFVDSIDLFKNRDRQNFIFNLMDRFSLRDQIQLENDLNQVIETIENHRDKKANEQKRIRLELTDSQKAIGMQFLKNPRLIDEIEEDYTRLGYVRERKNKILLYLVMTSRLMDTPLHTILISRSSAGKSMLVEVTEQLCPPEELHSVSDLTNQALYYYGKDDLKNSFIVIGEKEGREGSDYPLRELISKKSITKAIPMKDAGTGQIRTVSITVHGPVALAETTTESEVNPENLNRCFVVGIDESEEQTRLIHQQQRKNYTLEGHLQKRELSKVIEKHIYAQRLLRKILVVNPFAELLSFPTSKLKTRRDHDKFLRLINVICFLHQYQREVKTRKLDSGEPIEYIECTPADYRIAYELLSDGVLDNTLDDLPSPARKLLDLIKGYLQDRAQRDKIPAEKIVFERKDIREYTSWSFAQVRNNFRILRDYEYLALIKARNGVANQYRLNGSYSDIDFLHTILSPEELEKQIETVTN
jgi:hypothetical protein